MRAYGMTEKGPVRDMNEDSFAYETVGQCLCMAVADGVGGEACGEIASRIAVDSVIEAFKDSLPFVKEREDLPAYLKTTRSISRSFITAWSTGSVLECARLLQLRSLRGLN